MDRELMYNAWVKDRILLKPEIVRRQDGSVTVDAYYQGRQFRYTAYKEDMYGSADPYNIAYNTVLRELRSVNPKIELEYNEK